MSKFMIRCEKTYYPYFEVGKQYEIVIDKLRVKVISNFHDRVYSLRADEGNSHKAFGLTSELYHDLFHALHLLRSGRLDDNDKQHILMTKLRFA